MKRFKLRLIAALLIGLNASAYTDLFGSEVTVFPIRVQRQLFIPGLLSGVT
jgi:hypothetical protein